VVSSKVVKISGLHTCVLLISLEKLGDFVANFTVGHANIILGVTIIVHEREEAIIGDVELRT
jgi:hypothetical protein